MTRAHDHDDRKHHAHGMRPLRALVSLDEALAALMSLAKPVVRTERVSLLQVLHAVTDLMPFFMSNLQGLTVLGLFAARATTIPSFGCGPPKHPPGSSVECAVRERDQRPGKPGPRPRCVWPRTGSGANVLSPQPQL